MYMMIMTMKHDYDDDDDDDVTADVVGGRCRVTPDRIARHQDVPSTLLLRGEFRPTSDDHYDPRQQFLPRCGDDTASTHYDADHHYYNPSNFDFNHHHDPHHEWYTIIWTIVIYHNSYDHNNDTNYYYYYHAYYYFYDADYSYDW